MQAAVSSSSSTTKMRAMTPVFDPMDRSPFASAECADSNSRSHQPARRGVPMSKLLEQAEASLRENRLEEAAEACRKVLASQPRLADAHHLLGVVRFHQ